MGKSNLNKLVGFVLAAAMVVAMPALALATSTEATDGGTNATSATSEATDTGTTTTPTANEAMIDASVATANLSDVIAKDADGNDAMYTTLRDADGKVVATNDPKREVDDKYKSTSEGGKGTGIEKGATLYVDFRMAEIIENDGNDGIQEGVVYTMDLPSELIPSEKSLDGKDLIDPETPISFFHSGKVKATGGIYTKAEPSSTAKYELHIVFSDVVDQIDVAGEYQFGTTLSDEVEGGSTVELTYVPGGKLSFKVADDPAPAPAASYSAAVSGSQRGATVYAITSQLTKTVKDESITGDAFDYKTFTVKATDGNQGVWIDTSTWADSSSPNVFNGYGAGQLFTLNYTDASGSHSLTADASMASVDAGGHGVVSLKDDETGAEFKVTFNGVLEGSQSSSSSYIATSYEVAITEGSAKGLRSVQLTVPTVLTGDYTGSGSNDYKLSLTAKGNGDYKDLSATGKTSASLGSFGSAGLSEQGYNSSGLSSSLEYLPSSMATYLYTSTSSYYGNYYWTEFTPNINNSNMGENYYVSLASFLPNGALSSSATGSFVLSDGTKSTFMNGGAGPNFGLYSGQTAQNDWQYAGSVYVGELLNRNLASLSCFSDSATDAKLQYQLRQVFAKASQGQQVVVYRSASKNNEGKYSYIVIDPRTTSSAIGQRNRGWYNYCDGNGNSSSAKAGSWRLHIFNSPSTTLQATFPQYLGTFDVGDKSDSGSFTDKVAVGNGSFDSASAKSSTTATTGTVAEQQAAYMDSEWVSDDVIFWKMTINVANWQKWSDGYLYVKSDSSLSLTVPPKGAKVSNQSIDGSGMCAYYQKADGSWKMLKGSVDGKRNFTIASASDMNSNPTIGSNGSMYGYQISLPRDAGSTIDRASDNTITVGFFMKVGGKPEASNDTYKATAQLVCHTGDATLVAGNGGNAWPADSGSYSSYGQWAYRTSATGHAFMPKLTKEGALTDTATVTNLEAEWNLGLSDLASGTNRDILPNAGPLFDTGKPYYNGGFSGRFSAGDTMKGSAVKDASGNKVEGLDAGKYTHITQLFSNSTPYISEAEGGAGCGPIPAQDAGGDSSWEKYVDGEWVKMTGDVYWDPNGAGIYRNTLPSQGGTYSGTNPMSIYVYYAGNMSDSVYDTLGEGTLTNDKVGALVTNSNFKSNSLVVEYRGFVHATKVSNITYKTQTDVQSLYDAANAATGKTSDIDALTQLYNVTLSNGAGFGAWKSSDTKPVSKEISSWITASLSIAKSTPGVTRDETTGGTTGSYTLNTQVGLSDADYVNFQDYISGFSNVEVVDGDGASKDGASYKEGEGSGDAALKALVGSASVKDLKIEVTEASGSKSTIYENGAFTSSDWAGSTLVFGSGTHAGALYSGQLKRADGTVAAGTLFTFTYKLALDADGNSDFRNSDYYDGGALKIANGAVAERPYSTVGDSSTASAESASDDVSAQLASGDVVEMGDQKLQVVDDGTSLTGGEIDGDAKMLRVWPDADVEATYLAKDVLLKEKQKQSSDSGATSWMFWDWTGTQGKGSIDRTVRDIATQSIDVSLLKERDDLTDAQKQEYLVELDKLIGKYTTVANLKLYLTDSKPADASSLNDGDLLWQVDGTISADQSASKDGHQLSLKYLEPTAELDKDGINKVEGPGFSVSVTDLGLNKYLVGTYDMAFDRDGFLKEAVSEGLLNADGGFAGTTKTCAWSLNNAVSNGRGQNADASAGKVEVASSTVSKKASGVDASAGTANWTINANTGTVAGNGKLSISDKFTAAADNKAVAGAAQKASSIDEVKVSYAGMLIWENGALTEAAAAAGWAADNISVSVSGSELSLELSNTDSFKPVADNKDIKVTYKTKLDKQAYIQALSDAGVSFKDGAPEYALENAAALTVGSLKVSSNSKESFAPNAPVSATKTNEGHPGSDLATTRFVATATAGEVDRTNFYLQDKLDAVEGTDEAQRAATLNALELSLFDVTVADSAGASQSFTAQDVLDGKVDGVSLTCANGSKLSLNTPGMADWKLSFGELQAGTTVTVSYDVAVDRDAFLANGGAENETVTLANALNVGSKDGNTAAASSEGEVSVQKQIAKSGTLSDQKAANGNPIINWTFDVYLESSFTADELTKLQSVAVRDQLNIALKADTASVKAYDLKLADGKIAQGDELPTSEYEVSVDESNLLTVTLKNPQAHHNVRIVAPTELAASLDSINNTVELVVDGKTINKDEVKQPGADAITQWGSIVSADTPTFTPYAVKYVDGTQAGAEYKGAFSFTCVQIDENGNEVQGGYSSQASNDKEGVATFSKIVYKSKPREGTYYYRITEVAGEGSYAYDSTEYVVKVTVAKNQEDGKYLVSSLVTTPENVTSVRFDNSTKRSLSVTKQWDDDDNAAGKRPASVTVHLCQDGKKLTSEDATAVLSADNDWSYTWKDLPIAGGSYSVVEDGVAGYTASVGDVQLGEDGVWRIAVTNKISDGDHGDEGDTPDAPDSSGEQIESSSASASESAKTGDATNLVALTVIAGVMLVVAGFAHACSRRRSEGC